MVAHKYSTHIYILEKLHFSLVDGFDPVFYHALTMALLQYTRNVLSTEAIARYVLHTMMAPPVPPGPSEFSRPPLFPSKTYPSYTPPKTVLYLTHDFFDDDFQRGDYGADLLLHGLKELLGQSSVVDHPKRDCLYHTPSHHFTEAKYVSARARLYGGGFTFALKLYDELFNTTARHVSNVQTRIERHDYDLVILGSAHRKLHNLPLWDVVCQHYRRNEVAIVDGGDTPLSGDIIEKFAPCAQFIFSREGLI